MYIEFVFTKSDESVFNSDRKGSSNRPCVVSTCLFCLQYFYSIKDISVGGICMCNGHADACVQLSQQDNSQFVCRCKHQTCGIKCERCCPGFVQKPWKPATPDDSHECERELAYTLLVFSVHGSD